MSTNLSGHIATQSKFSRKLAYTNNFNPSDAKTYYCLISHSELDGLIGRLMQMCDLTGDAEQRKALKDTVKSITRGWLDDVYTDSGYDKWQGLVDKELVTLLTD